MKWTSFSLISLVLVLPPSSMALDFNYDFREAIDRENYHKALTGLRSKELFAGLQSDKMFDLSVPAYQLAVGPFTVYTFESIPGYHGLEIIAINGKLKRATEWSCTYSRVYFDAMPPDDVRRYHKLLDDNPRVESERIIGRLGWERPRKSTTK